MSATVPEVSFTELVQRPAKTVKLLDRARALLIRRRGDADDLILQSAERASQDQDVATAAFRLLHRLLREPTAHTSIARVITDVIPWTKYLPDDEVVTMITDLAEAAEGADSLDNLAPLAQVLIEWRHSADIYADPVLKAALTGPSYGDFGPVPPPPVPEDDDR